MQIRRTPSAFLVLAVLACLPTLMQTTTVRAQGSASTDNVSIPFDLTVFIPCANGGAGEDVNLSGNLHVLFHMTVSNSGRVTIKEHFQPQGISGFGVVTGDQYRGTGVSQQTQTSVAGADFPIVTTFVDNFRIIGAGTGNNLLLHTTIHVTVKANGEVTADVENVTADCK